MRARKDPRSKYLHQIAAKLEAKMRQDDEK